MMPPGRMMSADDVNTLIAWIDGGAGCDEADEEPEAAEYDPNTLDQGQLFVCDGPAPASAIRLRAHR